MALKSVSCTQCPENTAASRVAASYRQVNNLPEKLLSGFLPSVCVCVCVCKQTPLVWQN